MTGTRSGNCDAQRLCQLKKRRKASAAPRASGTENSKPGDPGSGWIVPHFVQLVIQAPPCPPSIIGSRKPRPAPRAKAVSHFILGQHSERVLDQALERL